MTMMLGTRSKNDPSRLLIGAIAIASLVLQTPSAHGLRQRDLGLGKWRDGPPTEIDCAAASSDFEYYVERCWDDRTQWWINGRCIDGKKEESSELHRCMRPDGSRPYCHDCGDGDGHVKNVCGSDSADEEAVCGLALSSSADGCAPDRSMAVYSHQCAAPAGGAASWYLREEFECAEREVYRNGPNMERVPPRAEFTCGLEWYYAYDAGDPLVVAANPDLADKAHPYASSSNRYCLDCGGALQVCASEAEATCEDLGLPPKNGAPEVSEPSSASLRSYSLGAVMGVLVFGGTLPLFLP